MSGRVSAVIGAHPATHRRLPSDIERAIIRPIPSGSADEQFPWPIIASRSPQPAFVLPHGISRHLLRSANVFNSVGLLLVSGLLLWQAAERILHPAPVVGSVVMVVGLLAAAANWGVARLLLAPSRNNAAIRLAYIHNIGDVYVSLAPVAAGLLVNLTNYSIFDPLIAADIAVWIIASTVREIFASSEELIWPEKIVCGHSDHEEAAIGAPPLSAIAAPAHRPAA
jgi:cobalt-zinc-cadmium efflux system protein